MFLPVSFTFSSLVSSFRRFSFFSSFLYYQYYIWTVLSEINELIDWLLIDLERLISRLWKKDLDLVINLAVLIWRIASNVLQAN